MITPFGEWTPDTQDLGSGCVTASGVIPRTEQTYGPVSSLSPYSSALTARCQGAFSCIDTSGNVNVFAGDATKLYALTSASTTWDDASKLGGYTTSTDERWSGALFGSRVMMTNYTDAIQSFVLGSSTDFADLAAAAPKARYITVARNFAIVGNTNDGTFGAQPQRVWWSALGDPTDWPTPGTTDAQSKQSDYQDLSGDGGWIQGVVGGLGTADLAVFMEKKIFRAQYIGSPAVFQFDAVEGARGTPAPGSIIQLGAIVFYLGQDGFYAFDGSSSTPIGQGKVDKFFWADVDQSYLYRINGAVDPINKVVAWAYPRNGNSGTCNRVIFYNWALNRWSYADLTLEILLQTLSIGISMEGLDAVSSSLDALAFSLDSRVWTGGNLVLSAFDTDHKLNYFTGTALEAVLETGELTGDGGQRVQAQGAIPIVDVTSGTVTISAGYRAFQSDDVSYTTATTKGRDGMCPARIESRYIRWKMTIAAGSTWTKAVGIDPRVKTVGYA